MIKINDTTFQVARRDGKPALTEDGKVLLFDVSDRRTTAHLSIDQLPF